MGYAEVELDPPSQFLKKHTRKEMRPFVGKVNYITIPWIIINSSIAGTYIIIRIVNLMRFYILFFKYF